MIVAHNGGGACTTDFGATSSAVPGLRRLLQQGSRLKKGAEQFYTAEDDFWKITSFAMERQRYEKAFKKAGIKKNNRGVGRTSS